MAGLDLIPLTFRAVTEFAAGSVSALMTSLRDGLILGGWSLSDPANAYLKGRWQTLPVPGDHMSVPNDTSGGRRTFRFVNDVTGANNVDGNILIGTDLASMEANFIDAVNRNPATKGISYAAAMNPGALVATAINPAETVTGFGLARILLTFLTGGPAGNNFSMGVENSGSTWQYGQFWFGGYSLLSKQSPWNATGLPPDDYVGRCLIRIYQSNNQGPGLVCLAAGSQDGSMMQSTDAEVVLAPLTSIGLSDHLYRLAATNYSFFLYIPGNTTSNSVCMAGVPFFPSFMQDRTNMKGPAVQEAIYCAQISPWRVNYQGLGGSTFCAFRGVRSTQSFWEGRPGQANSVTPIGLRSGNGGAFRRAGVSHANGNLFIDPANLTDNTKWTPMLTPVRIAWAPTRNDLATIKGFLFDCLWCTKPLPGDMTIKWGDPPITLNVFTGNSVGGEAPITLAGSILLATAGGSF